MCVSMSGVPSSSCTALPSSTATPPSSLAVAADHSELAVPVSTVAYSNSDMPAADHQSVLLLPTFSTVTPPSSSAVAADDSEVSVPMSTVTYSSSDIPAADHNYSQHLITPKCGKQRVHVLDISPYPKCKQAERRQNKSQKAEVLTSSPYKKAVQEKIMQPKLKPLKRKQQAPASTKVKKKRAAKTLNDATLHNVKKSRKQQQQGEDTTPCGVCKVRFCDDVHEANGREWIACSTCKAWFHNECQGLEKTFRPRQSYGFTCISCENSL